MRPRVFPAEDVVYERLYKAHELGFNEAAGIPRGRHVTVCTRAAAPMRFNEAAGIPRGRRRAISYTAADGGKLQ